MRLEGDTLLNHVLRAAMHVAEAEQIFVVVGHQAEQVKASVTIPGVRFAEQREQRGTGYARCAPGMPGPRTMEIC